MKRISKSFILAIALIILLTVPVLAAYTSMITVTESAGTSYTKLPIIANMNTTGLVTSGFISSTGLDTRVKSGSAELPHMLANDELLFVSDIDASQSKQFTFSTGNTPLTSFPIIVGEGGYITTADDADLEPHDSFILSTSLFLKDSGYYIYKEDSLSFFYNASTEVLYAIVGNDDTPDYTLAATGIEEGEHIVKLTLLSSVSGSFIYEQYTTGDDEYSRIYGDVYGSLNFAEHAQIFTPETTHDIESVWLLLYKNGSPTGNLTVDIVSFSGGVINNTPLASGSILTSSLTVDTAGNWEEIELSSTALLEVGTTYAIVIYADSNTDLSNCAVLRRDSTGAYAGGISYYRGNATYPYWNDLPDYDILFKEGGSGIEPELNFYVNDMGIPVDSEIVTSSVPDNGNSWILYPNPYINYFILETAN